jgi:hypothetical protein
MLYVYTSLPFKVAKLALFLKVKDYLHFIASN